MNSLVVPKLSDFKVVVKIFFRGKLYFVWWSKKVTDNK